ncbi:hypothetical protein LshimejAT787_0310380 [Lyophyllum shimeji]|uniref:Uncharacterized protein n=1 Tax=Lyophyllum shimeji TaxID=47721 RepID=A0A9P3PJW8_LYOSH|nr:hypothetical protein LshimejAT787_0310380 [Lyophyllum shimeji]
MSAPTSPFSLAEFSDLVALALNTDHADRLSESLLLFDPESLAPSNTPSSHQSTTRRRPHPSPRSTSTSPSSMRTTGSPPTSAWAVSTPSRPRQILDKIKRQASTFVTRAPEAEKPRSQAPPPQTIPTFSPNSGTRDASRSSFFDEDDEDEPAAFAPYIPLATQYERAAAAQPPVPSTKARSPALNIFSRPPSDITSPPPSPKSIRSISTTSSAAPVTPTTPLFAPRPSACSPDDAYNPRWSLCTDESSPSSYVASVSYQKHPFALPHDEHDPFAKGSVQVVRHSAHSQDGYNYGHGYQQPPLPKRKRSTRRRRTAPAPARPPPSGPLPTLPLSAGTFSSATPSQSQSESESADDESKARTRKISAPAAAPHPTAALCAPTIIIEPSEPPTSVKKVLRIHVPPATAFSDTPSSKVQDWTLSLPLNVAFPGSPSSPAPSSTASLHTPSPTREQPRPRTRSHSFLSSSSSSSSDDHSPASRCPSAWHPTPPSSAPLPLPAVPRTFYRSPSRSPTRSVSSTRASKLPHPPRTADSTTSTSSTETNESTASTESTATIVPSAAQRQRERERALAALTGPAPSSVPTHNKQEAQIHGEADNDNDSLLSGHTGTYYSARSSFSSRDSRISFGSAYGCRVRLRLNSGV